MEIIRALHLPKEQKIPVTKKFKNSEVQNSRVQKFRSSKLIEHSTTYNLQL